MTPLRTSNLLEELRNTHDVGNVLDKYDQTPEPPSASLFNGQPYLHFCDRWASPDKRDLSSFPGSRHPVTKTTELSRMSRILIRAALRVDRAISVESVTEVFHAGFAREN
jgi:hypothetical protein